VLVVKVLLVYACTYVVYVCGVYVLVYVSVCVFVHNVHAHTQNLNRTGDRGVCCSSGERRMGEKGVLSLSFTLQQVHPSIWCADSVTITAIAELLYVQFEDAHATMFVVGAL